MKKIFATMSVAGMALLAVPVLATAHQGAAKVECNADTHVLTINWQFSRLPKGLVTVPISTTVDGVTTTENFQVQGLGTSGKNIPLLLPLYTRVFPNVYGNHTVSGTALTPGNETKTFATISKDAPGFGSTETVNVVCGDQPVVPTPTPVPPVPEVVPPVPVVVPPVPPVVVPPVKPHKPNKPKIVITGKVTKDLPARTHFGRDYKMYIVGYNSGNVTRAFTFIDVLPSPYMVGYFDNGKLGSTTLIKNVYISPGHHYVWEPRFQMTPASLFKNVKNCVVFKAKAKVLDRACDTTYEP